MKDTIFAKDLKDKQFCIVVNDLNDSEFSRNGCVVQRQENNLVILSGKDIGDSWSIKDSFADSENRTIVVKPINIRAAKAAIRESFNSQIERAFIFIK